MKNHLVLLSVLLIFTSHNLCLAQKAKKPAQTSLSPDYDAEVVAATLTVGGEKHGGYSAQFDFAPDELEKGWWKYLKNSARVKNRKTYWALSIPPKKGESNIPVEMFSEIKKSGNKTVLTLVLNSVNMDAATRKLYLDQTRNFLQEFKAKFYRDYLQARLYDAEKRAAKASQEHQKYVSKSMKLKARLDGEANGDQAEVSEVKAAFLLAESAEARKAEELKKIQEEIDFLKKTLLNYIQKAN